MVVRCLPADAAYRTAPGDLDDVIKAGRCQIVPVCKAFDVHRFAESSVSLVARDYSAITQFWTADRDGKTGKTCRRRSLFRFRKPSTSVVRRFRPGHGQSVEGNTVLLLGQEMRKGYRRRTSTASCCQEDCTIECEGMCCLQHEEADNHRRSWLCSTEWSPHLKGRMALFYPS